MGAPRYYTDPLYIALKNNDYEEAMHMVDDYVEKNNRISRDAYFGVKVEGTNSEFFSKILDNIHIIPSEDSAVGPYAMLYNDLTKLRGGSRRTKQMLKKSTEPDAPMQYKNEMLYVCLCSYNLKDYAKTLLKQGASPNYPVDKFKSNGRTVMEFLISKYNKEGFDFVFKNARQEIFFYEDKELNSIRMLADRGLLEEWLREEEGTMTIEEKNKYQSYLLKNLINQDE